MYQEDIHPRFQDTKIKKDHLTTTTGTTTTTSNSSSSSSTPSLCHSTSSLLVRPSLKDIRNTSSSHFLHPINTTTVTTTTTTTISSSSSSIAFQRYSDFCDDCGIDVFRFCHEHWCKNFQ
ncbi:hypothetical protein BDC45DRAFT_567650 [Circinella umbellata]|nr:hypothetical protein BDC45DRAFT_567650 [Circinella umbellata]